MPIRASVVWTLGLAVACTSPPTEEQLPATEVQPPPPVVATETLPAIAEAPTAPLEIGWSVIPSPLTPEADALNKKALGLHRRGDYEGALAGFTAAIEASPGHAWARYNAACALSRLGRAEEAAQTLRPLLLEDFPQFRRRLLDDEDLEALRGSSEGASLAALLPKLAAAYDRALQRATPAFTYRERDGWTDDGSGGSRKARTPYTDLRVGVYDHLTRRFVPMTPRVKRAFSGLLLREQRRAIVALGDLQMKDMWEVQPHASSAKLLSLEDWGDELLHAKYASPRKNVAYGFTIWLGPDDTLYGAQHGVGYAPQEDYFHWTHKGRKKIGWTHDDTDRLTPPSEVPFGTASVTVEELAVAHYPAPTKAFVRQEKIDRKKVFVVGYEGIEQDPLLLERGHHGMASVDASPDPMIFTVTSNTIRFTNDGAEEDSPTTRDQHVVDLVNMHDRTVTRLGKAPGYAHPAWAPDGTLFVEFPDSTKRFAPGSTEGVADVPAGVHFGTPPFPEEGGV